MAHGSPREGLVVVGGGAVPCRGAAAPGGGRGRGGGGPGGVDAPALGAAAARLAGRRELRLYDVEGDAVQIAPLGTLVSGFDGVVADPVPAVFLVAHFGWFPSSSFNLLLFCVLPGPLVCVFVFVVVSGEDI